MRAVVAAWFRRHPLAGVALAAVLAVLAAAWHPAALVAALLVSTALAAWLGGPRAAIACFLCGLAAGGGHGWREQRRLAAAERWSEASGAEVVARVIGEPRGDDGFWLALARLDDGTRVWWESRSERPIQGTWLRGAGDFQPLREPRNPGEFDEAAWLSRRGVALRFVERGTGGARFTPRQSLRAENIRRAFRESIVAGLEPDSKEARVIRAVVVGERPPNDDELIAAFRHSGTLHVFCVSGLHVGMVGAFGWLLLRACGVPRRWAVLGLLPLMFGYAWITGNGPPAVRAAWMAAVFLMAFVWRRRPDLLNSLAAVLLALLLWDARLWFDPGVQLSYGVVAAIAIGVSWTSRLYQRLGRPPLYLPRDHLSRPARAWLWSRRWVAATLATSTAAWMGSTPLTWLHFGLVTPASVPASLFLLPQVAILLAVSLVSSVLAPLAPVPAAWLNRANARLAASCAFTAERFAALPGSHFHTRRERQASLLVYQLDYGAAAASFSDASGAAVLIDAGDRFSFERRILPSLRRRGVLPDSVVLSHPDGGHLGGAAAVWEALPLKQVLLPVERSRSPTFRTWVEGALAAGVNPIPAWECGELPMPDGARLEILHHPDPAAVNLVADERVLVLRLHWRGWRILFTSDAGRSIERALLRSGRDLRADVIVAGRHRGDLSLSDDFIEAVAPRAILASNAAFPPEERLPRVQADYWRSLGITVLDPLETGGVRFTIDPAGRLVAEGHADGSRLVFESPAP